MVGMMGAPRSVPSCWVSSWLPLSRLGGEIEVALQVAGVDDVDDDVGVLLYDVFSHVELFGRVCGERIGARQVDEGEVIPLEVE